MLELIFLHFPNVILIWANNQFSCMAKVAFQAVSMPHADAYRWAICFPQNIFTCFSFNLSKDSCTEVAWTKRQQPKKRPKKVCLLFIQYATLLQHHRHPSLPIITFKKNKSWLIFSCREQISCPRFGARHGVQDTRGHQIE